MNIAHTLLYPQNLVKTLTQPDIKNPADAYLTDATSTLRLRDIACCRIFNDTAAIAPWQVLVRGAGVELRWGCDTEATARADLLCLERCLHASGRRTASFGESPDERMVWWQADAPLLIRTHTDDAEDGGPHTLLQVKCRHNVMTVDLTQMGQLFGRSPSQLIQALRRDLQRPTMRLGGSGDADASFLAVDRLLAICVSISPRSVKQIELYLTDERTPLRIPVSDSQRCSPAYPHPGHPVYSLAKEYTNKAMNLVSSMQFAVVTIDESPEESPVPLPAKEQWVWLNTAHIEGWCHDRSENIVHVAMSTGTVVVIPQEIWQDSVGQIIED